ncbi:3-oxo-5-alpha-steroid 4-dehydrogenase family protein [Striga asiatica]|uniref:3-oxo-5-alpha-steroid 4-dehydrogenase family protein n=1 Tax=Striga asiatica TaxID=4170 RepID=A0A5A7PQI9_STRAF|nr:3-oxo-5-alpha-steroid 4-dehydrogenase family protein [Striga asiatica]
MLFQWMLNPASPMAVVWGLRAVWVAAISPIAIASFPSSKVGIFHQLFLKLSGRGKTMDASSKRLSVPQKFFGHFYILAVVWTTFLLVATWLYAHKTAPRVTEHVLFSSITSHLTGISHELFSRNSHSSLNNKYGLWKSVFLLLLMEIQVLRRLFETIYVFKYSPSARMHIGAYLTGLIFYIAAPLSLCSSYALEVFKFVVNVFTEFVVKGKDRMKFTEFDMWDLVSPLMQLKWYTWVGAAIFSWGWIHQRRCHAILGSLRENDQKVNDYEIPRGDWFEYVSSPHYLAEIVIYGGLVIASGFFDITMWLLFGFVVANLAFAAADTHRWTRSEKMRFQPIEGF